MNSPVIELESVSRRFGNVVAVDDVSFCVSRDSICTVPGGNGAAGGRRDAMRPAGRVFAMLLRYGPGAERLARVSIFAIAPLSGSYYPVLTLPE